MSKNHRRADRAEKALQTYIEARGDVYEANSSEIADLIADLLHLTMRLDQGDDPIDSTLRLARMHFDVEHGNPDEEADEEQASATEGSGETPAVFGAMRILIEKADGLIAAIEGVTDQFEREVSALSDAASAAEKALQAAGGAS